MPEEPTIPLDDMDISQMSLFEKSKMGLVEAKPHMCQEQVEAPWGKDCVLPCNQRATHYIGWPIRKEGPYRMCIMHTDHSIRNRGAVKIDTYRDKDGNAKPAPELS